MVSIFLAKAPKSDIMILEVKQDGESGVRIVGKINRNIYSVVSSHIQTDEVIITAERIAHIRKRHPNAFEQYAKYIQKSLRSLIIYWRQTNQIPHLY